MASKKFPDSGARQALYPNGSPASGQIGELFADLACTQAAEVYSDNADTKGPAIADSTITLDQYGRQPDYWGPIDGTDHLYIRINGVVSRVDADYDSRFDTIERSVLNVRDYGAVGDGVADDAVAIQATLNAAASSISDVTVATAAVRLPPGIYRTTTPLNVYGDGVRLFGDSPQVCKIVNSVSDIFHVQGYRQTWEGFTATADFNAGGGGHVFVQVGPFSSCTLRNFYFAQYNSGKSVWTAQSGDYLGNTVENGTLEHLYTATVPTWQHVRAVSGPGACNINTWRSLWITRSGNYNFWLEATTNYISDNRFEDINFEIAVGGGIKILSGTNNEINNCVFYDIAAAAGGGKAKQDLVYIGKNTGNFSHSNRLRGVRRLDGVLDTGVVDIRIPVNNGAGTVIEHCGSQSSAAGFTVDVGFGEVLVIGGRFATFLNDTAYYHLEPLLRGTTSATSSATPTPNAGTSKVYALTALAANATFAAPTGTPTDGQELLIRVKDNGVSRTLSWNAAYRGVGVSLPTATAVGKTLYVRLIYNAAASLWDTIAVAQES